MRNRQQGITAIGFVILAVIVGILGFGALKLTPVYLQNMKVKTILQDLESDLGGQSISATTIRKAIGKRLNIEMIYDLEVSDFEIKKSENGFRVSAKYEERVSFLGNLYLVAAFDDSVEVKR